MKKAFKSLLSTALGIGLLASSISVSANVDSQTGDSMNEETMIDVSNEVIQDVAIEVDDTFNVVNYNDLTQEQQLFYDNVVKDKGIYKKDNMYIVSLGQKPNTCYGLEFVKQEQIDNVLNLYFERIEPAKEQICGEALVYPSVVGYIDATPYESIHFLDENGEQLIDDPKIVEDPPLPKVKDIISSLKSQNNDILLNDAIAFKYTIKNQTDKVKTFEFSSGQTYEYIVRDAKGNEVLRYSSFTSFIQAFQTVELKPGEELSYDVLVEKAKLHPGTYTIEVWLTAINPEETYKETLPFEIKDEISDENQEKEKSLLILL